MNQKPTKANTIDLVLDYAWFDKIKSGKKKNEYRLFDKWYKHIKIRLNHFIYGSDLYLRLRRGYTGNFMLFKVKYVALINGKNTDLKVNESVFNFGLAKMIETNIK